jgi:hypothetical protein
MFKIEINSIITNTDKHSKYTTMTFNKTITLLFILSILLGMTGAAENCSSICNKHCGDNNSGLCAVLTGAGGAALGAHAGIAAMGTAIAATGPLALIGFFVGGSICSSSYQNCINNCLVKCSK